MATFTSKSVQNIGLAVRRHQRVYVISTRIAEGLNGFSRCLAKFELSRPLTAHKYCIAPFHTSVTAASYKNTEFDDASPKKVGRVNLVAPNWLKYNDIVYPPKEENEPERPAEVCHSRFQIKYSTKKLWYLACMIRGMSIDEAIKQLSFHKRKGAAHIKEVLEEAQEIAVKDNNVEFKSNLWIADSFVTKGIIVKGMRRHARGRYGIIHYRYTNYFVRLREGRPPKYYYPPDNNGKEMMTDYIENQRQRKIPYGM